MTITSPAQIPFDFGNQQYSDFKSFFPGQNQALVNLLMLVANNEVQHSLYLWVNKTSGKTHLLQASCRYANERALQVAYIPLKQYKDISIEILHDLGEMDLVCIDDLESICGVIEWQQGITWLYNELRDNKHSIIFSASLAINEINIELEDLRSRLTWDQIFQIKEADEDIKIRILKQEDERRSFELSDEVTRYLIHRVDRNLSSLLNFLDRIDYASLAEKKKITIPFVKRIIQE